MHLLEHDRWTVDILRLGGQKAYAVWLLLQQHPSLFDDDTSMSDPSRWYALLSRPGIIWLGVYEKHVLVGIIYLDFAPGNGDVDVHLVFFDRKPAEKTMLLRRLFPVVLEAFPRIQRITTNVPDIYTHTWKLAKRLGLRWEGIMKGATSIRGKRRDVYIFGAERSELLQRELE